MVGARLCQASVQRDKGSSWYRASERTGISSVCGAEQAHLACPRRLLHVGTALLCSADVAEYEVEQPALECIRSPQSILPHGRRDQA